MNISPTQSGYQLIQQSNRLTEQAANRINAQSQNSPQNSEETNNTKGASDASTQPNQTSTLPQSIQQVAESNKAEKEQNDVVQPLIDLNRANQYSKVGTNIIQREQQMIGSLLDTSV